MARSRGYNGGSNRSDLNTKLPVTTAPSQQYGAASQQQQAQQQVPMASGPPPAPQVASGSVGPLPGQLGAFDRSSVRPAEPVTHGLPVGAGAGPEALPIANDDVGVQLRALYQNFPNQDLSDLIEAFDDNRQVFGRG